MSGHHADIMDELSFRIEEGESMFLPMATVLETGNHIAQNGDGNLRRQCTTRFVDQVQLALNGKSPFTPINFLEQEDMQRWLDEFPDWAMQGSGLGDLSIVHDWRRLCQQNQGRRVYIWSLDAHLSGFDTA
jgi:hypothetical protein